MVAAAVAPCQVGMDMRLAAAGSDLVGVARVEVMWVAARVVAAGAARVVVLRGVVKVAVVRVVVRVVAA